MIRSSCRLLSRISRRTVANQSVASSSSSSATEDKPWENPWKHAAPEKKETLTSYEELPIDWKLIERILPRDIVPDLPKHASYPTPSGWRPPLDPPPNLPYYIARKRDHTLPLYLERKRDQLNEKTLDFDYVELVTLRKIEGDAFACEADLREFVEREVGHKIATHVDELKGRIKVKGADRTVLEKFLFEKGF